MEKWYKAKISEFLKWLLMGLVWFVRQVNQDGIRSVKHSYMYSKVLNGYIDVINEDGSYQVVLNNLDSKTGLPIGAKDFADLWNRNLLLWALNLTLAKNDKFEWKHFISMEGNITNSVAPIGTTTTIFTNDRPLSDFDNMKMDDIK